MIEAGAERAVHQLADIAVSSPDGQMQLVVEIKSWQGPPDDRWARLARELTARYNARFLLLAQPDRFILQRAEHEAEGEHEPASTFEIDASLFLSPYMSGSMQSSGQLSGSALQLAVTAWLADLVSFGLEQDLAPSQKNWLVDSGLYAAIKGGTVTFNS